MTTIGDAIRGGDVMIHWVFFPATAIALIAERRTASLSERPIDRQIRRRRKCWRPQKHPIRFLRRVVWANEV